MKYNSVLILHRAGALILGEFGPVLCEVRSKSRVRGTTPD